MKHISKVSVIKAVVETECTFEGNVFTGDAGACIKEVLGKVDETTA